MIVLEYGAKPTNKKLNKKIYSLAYNSKKLSKRKARN
jgi:hypothetical protein